MNIVSNESDVGRVLHALDMAIYVLRLLSKFVITTFGVCLMTYSLNSVTWLMRRESLNDAGAEVGISLALFSVGFVVGTKWSEGMSECVRLVSVAMGPLLFAVFFAIVGSYGPMVVNFLVASIFFRLAYRAMKTEIWTN